MAATWRATAGGVAFASAKDMVNVFNASASAKTISVYRVYQFNNGTSAVTGVMTVIQARRISAASAGTTVTPVAHNTGSAALDANTTAGTGRTTTSVVVFRRYIWTNEEPIVSGTTNQNWEMLVPIAEVCTFGYGSTDMSAFVCRSGQNEGFQLFHSQSTAVGSNDFEIEFTST